MMRKIILGIALLATLLGCERSHPEKLQPQKITVAYTYQPQSTLVHIAVEKGYFAEEGLIVESLMHTYGKAALQSVTEGKADFATVAETPVMFSVLKGEKIFVIANIEASTTNNAIVARKDAGIAKPSDLTGKRIAYTPGTTSDFFLDTYLTANGLTRQDIKPIGLKPEELQDAFVAKKIDAASTWNYPLTQITQQLGENGVIFYDRDIYTETFNIACQQDFVKQNPETVKRFLRALIRAEEFVAKNPDEAQSIMSAHTQIDQRLINKVWNAFNYHVVQGQTLILTLEDETRWAMKNKLTDQTMMPNYLDYLHLNSLREIKPEAVKMDR